MYGSQLFGGNDVEGTNVPIGSGIGLAHKYKNDGGVCFTVFGDGAINQGQVGKTTKQLGNFLLIVFLKKVRY